MKITEVKIYLLRKELSSAMCISRGGFTKRSHCIVEVRTDEGISGLGEGIGNAAAVFGILEQHIGPLALGLDPREIERVRTVLIDSQVYFERKGSSIAAASAIEMACWDIKAKALNVPLYQLLGGSFRKEIELYASDVYWEEDPAVSTARARQIVDRGIRTVKAHIGHRPPAEDTPRLKHLRDEIGPKFGLMVDLNAGYSYSEALLACQLWEEFNLRWLEEPLNPNHIDRMADLRNRISIPIAAGENEFLTCGFKDLLEKKAVDIVMPDIGRAGGIQETRNICTMAEAFGVEVSPHNFSSGILLAATIHLSAALPVCGPLEFDASDNAIYQELLVDPIRIKDGRIAVSESPGLGVELPPAVLKQYLAGEKSCS